MALTGVVAFQRGCPICPTDSILLGLVLWLCLLFPIGCYSLLSLQLIGEKQGGGRLFKYLKKVRTVLYISYCTNMYYLSQKLYQNKPLNMMDMVQLK